MVRTTDGGPDGDFGGPDYRVRMSENVPKSTGPDGAFLGPDHRSRKRLLSPNFAPFFDRLEFKAYLQQENLTNSNIYYNNMLQTQTEVNHNLIFLQFIEENKTHSCTYPLYFESHNTIDIRSMGP